MSGRRSWFDTFKVAFLGIGYAFRHERNMKVHGAASVAVIAAAAYFRVSAAEWLFLLLAIALVLTAEMINTSIERAVDLQVQEPHPLAKAAKDVAAGAVLLTVLFAVIAAAVIFTKPIIALLGG